MNTLNWPAKKAGRVKEGKVNPLDREQKPEYMTQNLKGDVHSRVLQRVRKKSVRPGRANANSNSQLSLTTALASVSGR